MPQRPSLVIGLVLKGLDAQSPNGKAQRETNKSDDVGVARGMNGMKPLQFPCKSTEAIPIQFGFGMLWPWEIREIGHGHIALQIGFADL